MSYRVVGLHSFDIFRRLCNVACGCRTIITGLNYSQCCNMLLKTRRCVICCACVSLTLLIRQFNSRQDNYAYHKIFHVDTLLKFTNVPVPYTQLGLVISTQSLDFDFLNHSVGIFRRLTAWVMHPLAFHVWWLLSDIRFLQF
jgi:hypothetical protein